MDKYIDEYSIPSSGGQGQVPCYFYTQICSPRHPKHADYRRMIIYGNETYKPPNAAS